MLSMPSRRAFERDTPLSTEVGDLGNEQVGIVVDCRGHDTSAKHGWLRVRTTDLAVRYSDLAAMCPCQTMFLLLLV